MYISSGFVFVNVCSNNTTFKLENQVIYRPFLIALAEPFKPIISFNELFLHWPFLSRTKGQTKFGFSLQVRLNFCFINCSRLMVNKINYFSFWIKHLIWIENRSDHYDNISNVKANWNRHLQNVIILVAYYHYSSILSYNW